MRAGAAALALVALAACSDPDRVRRALEAASAPEAPSEESVAARAPEPPAPAPGRGGEAAAADAAASTAGGAGGTAVAAVDSSGEGASGTAVASAGGGARASALTTPTFHRVAPGETLYGIARKHGLPLRALIHRNALEPPYRLEAGRRLSLPPQRVHLVRPGETLYGLSRRYGIDAAALARLNLLEPPHGLRSGQRLLVPGPEAENRPGPPPEDSFDEGDIVETPLYGDGEDGAAASAAVPEEAASASAAVAVAPAAGDPPAAPAPAPGRGDAAVRPGELPPRSGPGFLWPLEGRREVLAPFGPLGGGRHSDGVDIAARLGEPIRAAENGVVAYAGDDLEGYGMLLLLRHEGGWVTAYAHADSFSAAPGQVVRRGESIGRAGATGAVDSPRLHFELRKGTRAVDPLTLLRD